MEVEDKAIVLGLDTAATATGVVGLSHQTNGKGPMRWLARDIKPPADAPEDSLERAVRQVRELDDILEEYRVKLAVIEGYGFASQSLAPLVEVGTCYRLKLRQRGVPILVVAPQTLKKWATGRGNAKKDEVRLAIYKRFGFEHQSNNVVDAYALATIGLAMRGAPMAETAQMRAVLAKLQA